MNNYLISVEAAKFYLKSQGQAGTKKQIEKLMKQFDNSTIIRLATQRGFNA